MADNDLVARAFVIGLIVSSVSTMGLKGVSSSFLKLNPTWLEFEVDDFVSSSACDDRSSKLVSKPSGLSSTRVVILKQGRNYS